MPLSRHWIRYPPVALQHWAVIFMHGNSSRQFSPMAVRQRIRNEPPAGTAGIVLLCPFLFIDVCSVEYRKLILSFFSSPLCFCHNLGGSATSVSYVNAWGGDRVKFASMASVTVNSSTS